jgi:hypothetical protein
MSSLSTILVNCLVLNLRERTVKQLPTTVETVGTSQSALASLTTATIDDIYPKSLLCPSRPTKQIDCDSDSDT